MPLAQLSKRESKLLLNQQTCLPKLKEMIAAVATENWDTDAAKQMELVNQHHALRLKLAMKTHQITPAKMHALTAALMTALAVLDKDPKRIALYIVGMSAIMHMKISLDVEAQQPLLKVAKSKNHAPPTSTALVDAHQSHALTYATNAAIDL